MLPIRYFLKRRITLLAVIAVALCVFIVVVVMTIMNGLVRDFKDKNHNFVGDCIVSTDSLVGFAYYEDFMKTLENDPAVLAASTVINSYGVFSQEGADWSEGIQIIGAHLRHGHVHELYVSAQAGGRVCHDICHHF